MLADSRLILRPATRADGSALLAMVDAMADTDKMPHLDAEAQQRLLRDGFEKRRFEVVLAEWEGKPVGYVAFFETYSTFEARPSLFIDDLFVQPAYRGRHVAVELFRHCLREAKRRDCGRVEWLVLEGNLPAFGFYDHIGAKKLQKWIPFRLPRADFEKMV
jgi:GNAT superfamily N-acetyltransferase